MQCLQVETKREYFVILSFLTPVYFVLEVRVNTSIFEKFLKIKKTGCL
jgi:hypothetical protein